MTDKVDTTGTREVATTEQPPQFGLMAVMALIVSSIIGIVSGKAIPNLVTRAGAA